MLGVCPGQNDNAGRVMTVMTLVAIIVLAARNQKTKLETNYEIGIA